MKIGYDAKRAFHNTSGLGNYSRDLLRIMFKHREEHDYYLFNPKVPKRELFKLPASNNIHEINPSSKLHKIIHPIWRSSAVISECKKLGIELYHGLSNELPLGIKRSQLKAVVSIHDLIFMRFPKLYRRADRLVYRAKFEQACKEADRVIAISKQTADDLVSLLNVPSEKIEVVYQGCQPEYIQDYSKQSLAQIKESLALPDRFLLGVGTLERRKNQELILKAMSRMDEEIDLVLVGKPTSYKNELLKLAKDLSLSHRLNFYNDIPSEALAQVYRLSEMVLYPSLFEGFGIPIVEALASGVPIITSKDGCFVEAGGDAAIYTDPNDPGQLRGEIMKVLTDSTYKKEHLEAGKKHFEQFSESNIAKSLSEVYDI